MRFHKNGGEARLELRHPSRNASLWRPVGADPENKVIILTGTGEAFLRRETCTPGAVDREGMDDAQQRAVEWIDAHSHGKRLEMDLLEIEQPMIAALNGPCTIHAEIPLLCDIVLAAEHTVIADHVHFDFGLVPGDGVQVVYPDADGTQPRPLLHADRTGALGASNAWTWAWSTRCCPLRRCCRAPTSSRAGSFKRAADCACGCSARRCSSRSSGSSSTTVSHGLMMEAMGAVIDFPDAPMPEVKTPSELAAEDAKRPG